jgi:hypothetical protein
VHFREQYRAAADRRVVRGFPQWPQLSAFLGSAFLTGSGELSASSNLSGRGSCGETSLWEGSGASSTGSGGRRDGFGLHSTGAAARDKDRCGERHRLGTSLKLGPLTQGSPSLAPTLRAAARLDCEDFLEGFNQPTYRGMRINGQRVATWSSQHGWSGDTTPDAEWIQ